MNVIDWVRTQVPRAPWFLGSNRLRLVITAAFIPLLLPGCVDLKEVDDINIVVALCVDQVSPTQVLVTAEMPRVGEQPPGSQSGGGSQQQRTIIQSSTGTTIEHALDQLEFALPHELFLPHNTVVVFGDSYARQGLDRAIDYLERNRHFRRNELLVVTRGSARELLLADPSPMTLHAAAIRRLVRESVREDAAVNSEQLRLIRELLSPPRVTTLAAVDVGDNGRLESNGVGLVSNGRLTGYLDRGQTRILSLLNGQQGAAVMTIPCPDDRRADVGLSYRVLRNRTTITPLYTRNAVNFRVDVKARVELDRVCPSMKLKADEIQQVEQLIDRDLAKKSRALMTHLQEDNVDALRLGERVYLRHPALWHQLQPNWQRGLYAASTVDFKTQVQVLRTGLSSPSPLGVLTNQSSAPRPGFARQAE